MGYILESEYAVKKVLLVASGKSALETFDYDYRRNDWTIVAVNNGWHAIPELWDYWVRSPDFKGRKPTVTEVTLEQTIVSKYGPSLAKYGGQAACGYSITLNAGYWALDVLKPDVLGFLGADMNYTAATDGSTHFYGVGWDVQHNAGGLPDPDRMVNIYGKENKDTYLHDIYMRLNEWAAKQGCEVRNLSKVSDSRLPYVKARPSDFK